MPGLRNRANKIIVKRVSLTLFFCLLLFILGLPNVRVYSDCLAGSGDVDGSGKILPADALLVLKHIASRKKILTKEQLARADVDGDCKVTSTDALNILKLSVGKKRKDLGLPELTGSGTATPKITSISPQDGSTFYENDPVLISTTVTNPKQTVLTYQFSVDGVVKQARSNKSNHTWTAISGSHNLKVELKDSAGNKDAKEASIYVFRKPVSAPN